jgi:hypothetical protein
VRLGQVAELQHRRSCHTMATVGLALLEVELGRELLQQLKFASFQRLLRLGGCFPSR